LSGTIVDGGLSIVEIDPQPAVFSTIDIQPSTIEE